MRKILVIPMFGIAFLSYYLAELYGRSHYSEAIRNGRIIRDAWYFTLPHVPGEQALYWGSEFVVIPALAILLFVMGRDEILWGEWSSFFFSSLVGCFFFVVFPVAPPWVTGQSVIALGDPFGAMPSLHMADAVIVAICLGRLFRYGYLIGWIYVLSVGYSVISTMNHYPLDVVAGLALGVISMRIEFLPIRPLETSVGNALLRYAEHYSGGEF